MDLMKPLSVIEEIASTSKRNEKISLLEEIKNTDKNIRSFYEMLFIATYDSSYDYYIREFDENREPNETGTIPLFQSIYDLMNIIGKRMITGNAAKQWVEQNYQLLSDDNAEVFKRVIKRDLRAGISAKTINKVFTDLIYIHPYMRCSSFSKKNLENIKVPCYSQTKMDGLYIDIVVTPNKVEFRSRSGSFLDMRNPEKEKLLMNYAKDNEMEFVLSGEAVAYSQEENPETLLMNRQESNGFLNSDSVNFDDVAFFCWDIIPYKHFLKKKFDYTYQERFLQLEETLESLSNDYNVNNLYIVDTEVCNDTQEILEHFKKMREVGEEGTVIKNFSMQWKDGTSKEQVKVKVVFDIEMKAVAWKYGKGQFKDCLGAITFQSSEGDIEVSVGGGYKEDERKEWVKYVQDWVDSGKVATIRANDITQTENGLSLFLPRFVEWRDDKNEADSRERCYEILGSCVEALDMIKN
tara:strand:- start:51597 stop:52994 length:1398 start_codon:yes stop_codon:yes gene_type:complete